VNVGKSDAQTQENIVPN
jgi:hypothetical protein